MSRVITATLVSVNWQERRGTINLLEDESPVTFTSRVTQPPKPGQEILVGERDTREDLVQARLLYNLPQFF